MKAPRDEVSFLNNLSEHVQRRLHPAVADPVTGQWWSLGRGQSRKQLADLADRQFNLAFDNLAYGPLDAAFEHVHGMPIRDAWQRRTEKNRARKEREVKKHLRKNAVKEAMSTMTATLCERAALTVYGNEMSMRRYQSQRLANFFEVCVCKGGGVSARR